MPVAVNLLAKFPVERVELLLDIRGLLSFPLLLRYRLRLLA
jgi:hypothetical protein